MTRVLAVDTSTWWAGVALVEGERSDRVRVVAHRTIRSRESHANELLLRVDDLLALSGWSRSDVDLYAAARGPGSFTGIRVGLGTVRGLSLATDRPAVGVTTLEAIAEAHGAADGPRLPVMEAGRAELFGALYDALSSPPRTIEQPWLARRDSIPTRRSAAGAIVIPGRGTELDPAELPQSARLVPAPHDVAAAVGRIACLRGGGDAPEATLAPLYIRPPDALLKRRTS